MLKDNDPGRDVIGLMVNVSGNYMIIYDICRLVKYDSFPRYDGYTCYIYIYYTNHDDIFTQILYIYIHTMM